MRPSTHQTLIYMNQHAVTRLNALANPQAVTAFIDQLQSTPGIVGDHRQPDPQGRIIEVKILGRQAVLYFSDPFANTIKILDIRNVEGER